MSWLLFMYFVFLVSKPSSSGLWNDALSILVHFNVSSKAFFTYIPRIRSIHRRSLGASWGNAYLSKESVIVNDSHRRPSQSFSHIQRWIVSFNGQCWSCECYRVIAASGSCWDAWWALSYYRSEDDSEWGTTYCNLDARKEDLLFIINRVVNVALTVTYGMKHFPVGVVKYSTF